MLGVLVVLGRGGLGESERSLLAAVAAVAGRVVAGALLDAPAAAAAAAAAALGGALADAGGEVLRGFAAAAADAARGGAEGGAARLAAFVTRASEVLGRAGGVRTGCVTVLERGGGVGVATRCPAPLDARLAAAAAAAPGALQVRTWRYALPCARAALD